MGWPLKMCKYQGQKRCLQRYWYSFSLPWRCKYFQNTLLTILGVKITIFITKWLFRGVNWIKCVKTVDFDHKKFGNIFWKYLHLHGSEKLYGNNVNNILIQRMCSGLQFFELAKTEKGRRSSIFEWSFGIYISICNGIIVSVKMFYKPG